MWAHYASNHFGFCLEFDTNNSLFGRAYKVRYIDAINKIDIVETDTNVHFNSLLTKTTDWQYESEYRIIGESNNTIQGLPELQGKTFSYSPTYLTSIIFGALMDESSIRIVTNWLDDSFDNVKFKKVALLDSGQLESIII